MALSDIDWYSFRDKSLACFSFIVGSGWSAAILVGNTSSSTDADGESRETGVCTRTWLARFVYERFWRGSVATAATGVEVFLEVDGVDGATGCTGEDALLFAVDSRRSRPDILLLRAVPSDMVARALQGW